jgi:23S rRNA (adenine2503-C2)-methyltransferase
MPINAKYPLGSLVAALRAYPLPRRRRITIEYTLIAGRNDAASDATKLARLLRGIPVKVNLIPMNPIAASDLRPPAMTVVLSFQRILCDAGLSCFIRRRRGDDVDAACGQLALLGGQPKVRAFRNA